MKLSGYPAGKSPARKFLARNFIIGALALSPISLIGGCKIGDSGDSGRHEDRELSVPKKSEIVAEGKGDLSYKARRDGVIYVYDNDDSATLFRQRIREGQRLTLSPEQNLATLDGKKVYDQDLTKKHTHRLYFERE